VSRLSAIRLFSKLPTLLISEISIRGRTRFEAQIVEEAGRIMMRKACDKHDPFESSFRKAGS
jgi:hypothetical protein